MARPPPPRNAPILSDELVWHVVWVAALFLAGVFSVFTYALDKGYPLALAQIALETDESDKIDLALSEAFKAQGGQSTDTRHLSQTRPLRPRSQ